MILIYMIAYIIIISDWKNPSVMDSSWYDYQNDNNHYNHHHPPLDNYTFEDWSNMIHPYHAQLLGPVHYGTYGECPPNCGCVETPYDCPRWYDFDAIRLSANHTHLLWKHDNYSYNHLLDTIRLQRRYECSMNLPKSITKTKITKLEATTTQSGGWCLTSEGSTVLLKIPRKGSVMELPIPRDHVPVSKRILQTLKAMIRQESIQSILDLGAGVGQYKAGIESNGINITYRAYDGAGNIESYTKGYVSFMDLTIPLQLPISDWVLSLAVGEHIPSRYEGMVIRNLHRHNRYGIILMWGLLGMNGTAHINNHSLEYILHVFHHLGYTVDDYWTQRFRQPFRNYFWFVKGALVLRRTSPSV
jgi:hypothetical protein